MPASNEARVKTSNTLLLELGHAGNNGVGDGGGGRLSVAALQGITLYWEAGSAGRQAALGG